MRASKLESTPLSEVSSNEGVNEDADEAVNEDENEDAEEALDHLTDNHVLKVGSAEASRGSTTGNVCVTNPLEETPIEDKNKGVDGLTTSSTSRHDGFVGDGEGNSYELDKLDHFRIGSLCTEEEVEDMYGGDEGPVPTNI